MNGNRDKNVLVHIIHYCDQITEAIGIFGNDYDTFSSSNTYRNACCLCLLQIGELVGTLSDSFLNTHKQIPWRQIKGFRNIVAHAYGTIEPAVVWDIISNLCLRSKITVRPAWLNFKGRNEIPFLQKNRTKSV